MANPWFPTQPTFWQSESLRDGIAVPRFLRNTKRGGRAVLPIRPLWPGFAINTLFYAMILWGLFAATFTLRRRRRIHKDLCPRCTYPVGECDVCTECGTTVKRDAMTNERRSSTTSPFEGSGAAS